MRRKAREEVEKKHFLPSLVVRTYGAHEEIYRNRLPAEFQGDDEAGAEQPNREITYVVEKGHLQRETAHITTLRQAKIADISTLRVLRQFFDT